MNIQENEYYICRNGELVGPMVRAALTLFVRPSFTNGKFGAWYDEDGTFGYGNCRCSSLDIVDTVDNAARKHVEGN